MQFLGCFEDFKHPQGEPIELRVMPSTRVVPAGIETGDRLHELEALIDATGFRAVRRRGCCAEK